MESMGRQEAKSERARKAIIEATIKSLAKQGYSETSLVAVSRAAGYTKGALQHHFVNREDLVAATLDELLSRTMRPYSELQNGGKSRKSVVEGLMQAWERHVNTEAYQALLEILNASRVNSALRSRISDDLVSWGAKMDARSIETYESADGANEDVAMLLNMNRCFMRGLLLQNLYGADKEATRKYLDRWIKMIAPLLKYKE